MVDMQTDRTVVNHRTEQYN